MAIEGASSQKLNTLIDSLARNGDGPLPIDERKQMKDGFFTGFNEARAKDIAWNAAEATDRGRGQELLKLITEARSNQHPAVENSERKRELGHTKSTKLEGRIANQERTRNAEANLKTHMAGAAKSSRSIQLLERTPENSEARIDRYARALHRDGKGPLPTMSAAVLLHDNKSLGRDRPIVEAVAEATRGTHDGVIAKELLAAMDDSREKYGVELGQEMGENSATSWNNTWAYKKGDLASVLYDQSLGKHDNLKQYIPEK